MREFLLSTENALLVVTLEGVVTLSVLALAWYAHRRIDGLKKEIAELKSRAP